MRNNSRKEQDVHGAQYIITKLEYLVSLTAISLYIVMQSESKAESGFTSIMRLFGICNDPRFGTM